MARVRVHPFGRPLHRPVIIAETPAPTYEIRGRVTLPNGSAAGGKLVEVMRPPASPGAEPTKTGWQAETDLNGSFTIDGVLEGSYLIRVLRERGVHRTYQTESGSPVSVPSTAADGTVTYNIELKEAESFDISGTVTAPADVNLVGIPVQLFRTGETTPWKVENTTTGGAFIFENVPEDDYRLTIPADTVNNPPLYVALTPVDVPVDGAHRPGIVLALQATARYEVEGTVLAGANIAQATLAGRTVQLMSTVNPNTVVREAVSRTGGGFTIEDVPVGTYTLRIPAEMGLHDLAVNATPFTVPDIVDGRTITLHYNGPSLSRTIVPIDLGTVGQAPVTIGITWGTTGANGLKVFHRSTTNLFAPASVIGNNIVIDDTYLSSLNQGDVVNLTAVFNDGPGGADFTRIDFSITVTGDSTGPPSIWTGPTPDTFDPDATSVVPITFTVDWGAGARYFADDLLRIVNHKDNTEIGWTRNGDTITLNTYELRDLSNTRTDGGTITFTVLFDNQDNTSDEFTINIKPADRPTINTTPREVNTEIEDDEDFAITFGMRYNSADFPVVTVIAPAGASAPVFQNARGWDLVSNNTQLRITHGYLYDVWDAAGNPPSMDLELSVTFMRMDGSVVLAEGPTNLRITITDGTPGPSVSPLPPEPLRVFAINNPLPVTYTLGFGEGHNMAVDGVEIWHGGSQVLREDISAVPPAVYNWTINYPTGEITFAAQYLSSLVNITPRPQTLVFEFRFIMGVGRPNVVIPVTITVSPAHTVRGFLNPGNTSAMDTWIELWNTAVNPNTFVAEAQVNDPATGGFEFPNVPVGNYQIRINQELGIHRAITPRPVTVTAAGVSPNPVPMITLEEGGDFNIITASSSIVDDNTVRITFSRPVVATTQPPGTSAQFAMSAMNQDNYSLLGTPTVTLTPNIQIGHTNVLLTSTGLTVGTAQNQVETITISGIRAADGGIIGTTNSFTFTRRFNPIPRDIRIIGGNQTIDIAANGTASLQLQAHVLDQSTVNQLPIIPTPPGLDISWVIIPGNRLTIPIEGGLVTLNPNTGEITINTSTPQDVIEIDFWVQVTLNLGGTPYTDIINITLRPPPTTSP
jgi:hypothetical protein